MPKSPNKFKPFVGRCFQLKNYTTIKSFPQVILVMDETKKEVMFLDNTGTATWILKFYLRDVPIESRVFSSADTLTEAMSLLETMRSELVSNMAVSGPGSEEADKEIKALNKRVQNVLMELRDLGTRMQGVRFAPKEEESSSEGSTDAVQ